MSPSPPQSNHIPIQCHLYVHFWISACARPTWMCYIHLCLFRLISFGLIELSYHSMTHSDHFIVFHIIPIYLWRGNVLFLSPWHTWLPLDISLIRMSPGYSLDYKILVVWWIKKSFTCVHWSHISRCKAVSSWSSSFLSYLALVLGQIYLISLLLSSFHLWICGTHHQTYIPTSFYLYFTFWPFFLLSFQIGFIWVSPYLSGLLSGLCSQVLCPHQLL